MFNGGYGVAMLYIIKWSFCSTRTAPAVTMSARLSVVFVMAYCATSFCWILAAEFVSWAFTGRQEKTTTMGKVVTVARKEIMAFPRSQLSGKLDKERGRPGCDNVPRRHTPYRVDLILSISRRSPSVTVVTEGGLRCCPLPSAFWREPPALAGGQPGLWWEPPALAGGSWTSVQRKSVQLCNGLLKPA